MRYTYITITVTILFAMLFSCTAVQTSLPGRKQKAGTDDHPDSMDNSIRRKGYILAKTECAECHRFYSPEEYSPDEWDRIIKVKAKRLSLEKDLVDALDLYFQSEFSKFL